MTTASPTLIRNPWRRVWRWVSSDVWLAVTLSLLATLLVLSVLLPQTPASDPVAYSRWLSETQQRFGSSWSLFNVLGLFQITGSIVFRLLAGALGLNCAVRLIEQITQLRHAPDRPTRPKLDRLVPIERETLIGQLRGYQVRADGEWLVAERSPRLHALAGLLIYGGALIVLLGLVLGTLIDSRLDGIRLEPNAIAPVSGTPYALRLDAWDNGRASLALLRETESIGQGAVADRQPWISPGPTIYLEGSGPALIVSATNDKNQPLGLQSTVDSPPQPEKAVVFEPERADSFLAVSDNNLVLQLTRLADGRYVAQALQSASGKVLASQEVTPGATFTANAVTFSFREAVFIEVAAVTQPSHWFILVGWVSLIVGLGLGTLGSVRRVWLQAIDQQTRILTDEADPDVTAMLSQIEETEAPPVAKPNRAVRAIGFVLWVLATIGVLVVALLIYPRSAQLIDGGFKFAAAAGAWLLLACAQVMKADRLRGGLIGLGVVAAVLAVGLSITA
ncbi:MAG: hypothetical protein U0559_03400 [Anaerolineae bacterium]